MSNEIVAARNVMHALAGAVQLAVDLLEGKDRLHPTALRQRSLAVLHFYRAYNQLNGIGVDHRECLEHLLQVWVKEKTKNCQLCGGFNAVPHSDDKNAEPQPCVVCEVYRREIMG